METTTNNPSLTPAFSCSICGFTASPDCLFNIKRSEVGGKLVILCKKELREARNQKYILFRLSATLEHEKRLAVQREAKRESERIARSTFFQALGKAQNEPERRACDEAKRNERRSDWKQDRMQKRSYKLSI
jgi:hypothetical protein